MSDLQGLVDDLHVQAHYAHIDNDIPDQYAEMQEQLADRLEQLVDHENTNTRNEV